MKFNELLMSLTKESGGNFFASNAKEGSAFNVVRWIYNVLAVVYPDDIEEFVVRLNLDNDIEIIDNPFREKEYAPNE